MQNENQRMRYFSYLVCVIFLLTNVSQMPYFDEGKITRFVAIPPWILLTAICLYLNHLKIRVTIKGFFIQSALFAGYYYCIGALIPAYFRSSLPYNIFLSIFIALVGVMAGENLSYTGILRAFTAYILGGMVVCWGVYYSYVRGQSLSSRLYLTDSKNSLSQILLTAWILILLFKFQNNSLRKRIFYGICLAFLTYIMIALKSRATLLGMPIMIMWVLYNGQLNKKLKHLLIYAMAGLSVFLLLNPSAVDFLIDNIILANRSSTSLADLSSGRSVEWQNFFKDWYGHEIFGMGRCKRESVILTSLLEFGIVGGGIVLSIVAFPFLWGITYVKKSDPFYLAFTGIALVYLSNGFFEQLAPFGPGVKCYFLWFFMGALSSIKDRRID